MLARREVAESFSLGSHGSTFGGNAVACAAALATLEVIDEEDLVGRAAEMGAVLRRRLDELAADTAAIGEVRGLGLMLGVEFTGPDGVPDADTATRAQQAAADAGLLLLTCGTYGNVVRFLPPLVVDAEQVEEGSQIFAAAVEKAVGG
jgi:4-aminobutyrate aminotransferase